MMYKVCIIGCGLISRSHANAIKAIEDAMLVGVCDVRETAATEIAIQYNCKAFIDCDKMLSDLKPDVAIICVPTFLHRHYVELCGRHGVNVLCEKPLERTVPDAEALLESVKKSGIIFMTAQVVRFWSGYVMIKEMMDREEIGDIYMAFLRRVSSKAGQYGEWLFKPELGGGAMHDMLVHDVDFLRYLFGPFEHCYANAAKDETGCYNHVIANIVHKDGIRAVAEASMTMQTGYPFSFSIILVGTKATVEYRYSAGATIAERSENQCEMKIYRKDKGAESVDVEIYDAYEKQLRYFLDCCRQNEQPEVVPHHQSLEVIRMVQAIHDSADTGLIVSV